MSSFFSGFWKNNQEGDPVASIPSSGPDHHGSGYDSDLSRDIQQVRQILDGYSGRAWLKEMVQNADDAGAGRLELGWTAALPGVAFGNPLLGRTPAVLVFNDGPFRACNARAIRKLGSSDRNADGVSIGRFGLGMKSLFHWCEAFFYLSSGDTSFSDPVESRNGILKPDLVFSPWFHREESRHLEWNTFGPEDRRQLRSYLDRMGLIRGGPWFCLWIPLRLSSRDRIEVSGIEPIVRKFPGDTGPESVFGRDLAIELTPLLPMLKVLRVLRIWADSGRGEPPEILLELNLPASEVRCRRPRLEAQGSWPRLADQTWAGTMELGAGPDAGVRGLPYWGAERLGEDAGLAGLLAEPDWPRTQGTDPESFAVNPEKVRRAPHSAAYIVRSPAARGSGELKIRWAAFLPLGDEPFERVPVGGDTDLTLILHGDFFPDVSRTRVNFPPDGDRGTRDISQRWNMRLRDVGTLPLVLTALDRLAGDDADNDATRVTQGLLVSAFFGRHRGAICSDRQWAFCLEQAPPRWRLIPASDAVHGLPAPPDSLLHEEVFAGLAETLGLNRHVTPTGCPRLHPREDVPAAWPADLVSALVRSVPVASVFGEPTRLAYLADFLDSARAGGFPPPVGNALCDLAHQAFMVVGARGLATLTGPSGRFFDHLPPGRRLGLDVHGVEEGVVEELLRAIGGLDVRPGVVLVPLGGIFGGWQGPSPSAARMDLEDARKILPVLARIAAGSLSPSRRSALARQLIAALGDAAQRLDGECYDLCLFLGRDSSEAGPRLLSPRELAVARERGLLFTGDQDGLAFALGATLHKAGVVMDESGVVPLLFGGGMRPCDPAACLRVLSQAPPLVTSEGPRTDLLRKLLKALPADAIGRDRRALRYLLHGLPERFGSDEPLFAGVAPGLSPVWRTLGHRSLATQGGEWRTVADELPDFLQLDEASPLRVRPLDREAVIGLIRGTGPALLDVGGLTTDDRDALVRECEAHHFDVVKALPIHRSVDGRLVPLDDLAYWRGGYPIPEDLPAGVVLLEPAADPELHARQLRLHGQVLGAEGVLGLILKSPDPASRWRTVVGALRSHQGELSGELKGLLRRTQWLPVEGSTPAAPEELIWINPSHSQELIRDVLTDVQPLEEAPRGVPLLSLAEDLRNPERYKEVSERFEARFDVRERDLKRLGAILATDERYCIGSFEAEDFDPESFLRVFENAPDDVMRCQRLVRHLCEEKKTAGTDRQGQVNQFRKNLLPRLLGKISPGRFVSILCFLADEGGREPAARRESRVWFNHFLRSAVRLPEFRDEVLPRVRFRDGRGDWRRPEELSLRAEGVADRYLVDSEQAAILRTVLPSPQDRMEGEPGLPGSGLGTKPTPEELDLSAGQLVEQAKLWASAPGLPPEAVGGLLALLGDHETIARATRRYLGNRPLAAVLDKLGWREKRTVGGEVLDRGDATARMEGQRFIFEFNASKTVSVHDLLGRQVLRPMREDYEHLWLDWRWYGGRTHRIQLRAVATDHLPAGPGMASLLKETARRLLDSVYHQTPDGLDDLWDELASGEQLDVAVAQSRILRSAFGLLRATGVPREGLIHETLRTWEDAQRHRAEADRDRTRGRELAGSVRLAEELETQAIEGLRSVLVGERGEEPVRIVLEAVRRKIFQFEYEPDSVPFELFQNADDASVELVRMCGDESSPDLARRFMLLASGAELRAFHEGRPVNRWRRGEFDGRAFGFDDDLVKMLQINWSDKARDPDVSGRFGLGFKSVFLVCNAPRVLSGRLSFEVVAGLYPKELGDDTRRALEAELPGHPSSDPAGEGTLFLFDLRDGIDADQVAGRFARVAHVLVVFARRLRTCVVALPGRAAAKTEWQDRDLPGVPGAFVGRLRPANEDAGREMTAMVLRESEHGPGALLLGLDADGFVPLPASLPSVWATAPLREESGSGLAMNSDFDLNPGRALLAQDPARNASEAARIGRHFGTRFVALFDAASSDWATIREAIGLKPDAAPGQLWHSLWKVAGPPLSQVDTPTGQLLRRAIWGEEDRGIRRLIGERDALPTGLPGAHAVLTRPGRVSHAAGGLLADPGVFEAASVWPRFAATHRCGTIISRDVSRALKGLLGRDTAELRLADVARAELSGAEGSNLSAEPALADQLGGLLNVKFIQTPREGAERDRDALAGLLSTVMFLATSGRWQSAGELLIADQGEDHADETARAAFAPPGHVLHADYGAEGREFARACRPAQRMNAPVERMANWAWEADEARRTKVVDYLVRTLEGSSKLAARLRQDIVETGRDGWIARLATDSPYLGHLDDWWRRKILTDLGIDAPRIFVEPAGPPPPLPGESLERIYRWVLQNGDWIQGEYERLIYLDGRPEWHEDGPGDETATRRDWLILLAHGAMHTMGRTRTQHGGGFLRFCSNRGYLDTFADPNQDLNAWMNVVHDYLDRLIQGAEYYQWMGQFVPIFQLARWLGEYGELFLSIDRWDEARHGRFTLSPRLAPRTDPHSSVDAPPLTRVLGIGACFVLRELVRTDVLGHGRQFLHPYCYPPYRRVLRLLNSLGCDGLGEVASRVDRLEQSADIYNLLRRYLGDDRATFRGLFDLPLLMLANSPDLREQVLGTTIPTYNLIPDDDTEGPTC